MSDLLKLSLEAVTAKLRAREVSATELAKEALAACQSAQGALNAFTAFDEAKTLAMAKASDERLARGEGGLLEGAPLAIKDLFA
ncbi:amidase family protein, partial [uncultured Maricaulis sp.]|uniref:amidase family protein n=1 Tax=uncultured Maricaulis sp. TaxID=174710 RepID=UPI0030D914B1